MVVVAMTEETPATVARMMEAIFILKSVVFETLLVGWYTFELLDVGESE